VAVCVSALGICDLFVFASGLNSASKIALVFLDSHRDPSLVARCTVKAARAVCFASCDHVKGKLLLSRGTLAMDQLARALDSPSSDGSGRSSPASLSHRRVGSPFLSGYAGTRVACRTLVEIQQPCLFILVR
jgi:hypothetical protein